MTVSREDIDRTAQFARLRVSEAEAEELRRVFNTILDYVETLGALPPDEPDTSDAGRDRTPERAPRERGPDPVTEPPAEYAPEFKDGLFVVPSPPSLGNHGEVTRSP